MANKDFQQDEISQLLDSFYEDNTLEQRIENFSKKKELRKSRVEKNREVETKQIVVNETEDTSKLGETKENVVSNQSGSKTIAFDTKEIEKHASNESNGTVVIDDKKIKSILKEENGIKLNRKVIAKDEAGGDTKVGGVVLEKKIKQEPEQDAVVNRRTIAVIVAAILGLILVGLVIFGVTRAISNFVDNDESSEVQEQYYQEIIEWAQGYNTYTDEEKNDITEFEKKYNKLTKEQKSSIDKVLKEQTTKTFDELLAMAKSSKKENSKNNNTEIAQKKAELKEKINDLKSQLATAQSDLDDANKELTRAQEEVNSKQQEIDSLNAEINQYNDVISKYADLTSQLESASDDEKEQIQNSINELQSEYNSALSSVDTANNNLFAAEDEMNYLQDALNQASQAVQEAQAVVDDLTSQIAMYQSEFDELK